MKSLSLVFLSLFSSLFSIQWEENIFFPIDNEFTNYWKLGLEDVQSENKIYEWVPKDQSIHKWKECITIQVLNIDPKKNNIVKTHECLLKALQNNYPLNLVEIENFLSDENQIYYSWQLPPPHPNAQKEWIKIIKGTGNFYTIHYTSKDGKWSKWVDLVAKTTYEEKINPNMQALFENQKEYWTIFRNEQYGFTIPNTWESIVLDNLESYHNFNDEAYVKIKIAQLPPEEDPIKAYKEVKKDLKGNNLGTFKKEEWIQRMDGKKIYSVIKEYKQSKDSKKLQIGLRFCGNKIALIITACKPELFSKYQSNFKEIIASFIFPNDTFKPKQPLK